MKDVNNTAPAPASVALVFVILLVVWFLMLRELFPRGFFTDGGVNLATIMLTAFAGAGVSLVLLTFVVRALPYWLVFGMPVGAFLAVAYGTESPSEGYVMAAIYGVMAGGMLVVLKAWTMATTKASK